MEARDAFFAAYAERVHLAVKLSGEHPEDDNDKWWNTMRDVAGCDEEWKLIGTRGDYKDFVAFLDGYWHGREWKPK